MSLIIPVGFAQVTLPFKHDGVNREAVITFGVDTSAEGGDFVGMCEAIVSKWSASLGALVDSNVTVGPARATVGQDGGPPIQVVGSVTSVGGRGLDSETPNTALLVQKRTALGGRRGRGRFYIPWIVGQNDVNEAGNIENAAMASFQPAADDFLELLADDTDPIIPSPMVILHDSSGAGVEPSPTPVTSLTCDRLVGSQRRRLGR